MNKRLFRRYVKISITLFVLFNFSSITSQAGIKNIKTITFFNSTDKVVISGTIKDESGKPLENARIVFDSTDAAITDKDGKFNFELPVATVPGSHNIYFGNNGFITVVRSYNTAMLSTN